MKKTANTSTITTTTVAHVGTLAHLPLQQSELEKLQHAFVETLAVIENLKQLDVSHTEPTHQVTGLENVWRDDVVLTDEMFSQQEALANAAQTHQGFVVVPRVLED